MIDNNKTNTEMIGLPKQRELVQDFAYASISRAKLRKNKKQLVLRKKVKFKFKRVKQAFLNYRKRYFNNLKQQKLEAGIKITKKIPVIFIDKETRKKQAIQAALQTKKLKRLSKKFTKKLKRQMK